MRAISTFIPFLIILGFCCAITTGTSSLAVAGFDEGMAVFRKGDFKSALQEFRVSGNKGNTESQFYLGLMYSHGLGVAKDHQESVQWYLKAAEGGHVRAQYLVGLKYDTGQGFARNFKEAIKWYRRAAKQGSANAQRALGLVYSVDGAGAQDYVRAHMWLNIASANGNKTALEDINVVEQKMTTDQVSEAQKLAQEWMRTHCRQSLNSQESLGDERIGRQKIAKPECKGELKVF